MSSTSGDSFESSIDTDELSIKLDSITKTFGNGSIVAVNDVSLNINSDEFVVFLGPSGCGKTTTLRCIAGLEIPDEGRIEVGDRDITHERPKDRDLAFVFQEIALFPHMDVRSNMRFGLDMGTDLSSEEKNQRVEEAADLLGISELLDRPPAELSGGQQQRVSLGRAMVMEPIAFLLDEPFSALDANLRDQMQTEIKRLHNELERAMIFVTHDQEEAMTVGDKIVVMDDGAIQQVGTPHEVYNDPASQFVAQFIGSPTANFFECTLEEGGEAPRLSTDIFTLQLSGDQADQVRAYNGDSLTLGIRPEHLSLGGSDGILEGNVEFIEPQGPNDTVYLETQGKEVRATTQQAHVKDGQKNVTIDFDNDEIWIFKQSGERLA